MPPSLRAALACAFACLACVAGAVARDAPAVLPDAPPARTPAAWRTPVAPFRIAERTWYVGTLGIAALLVKTDDGAVLIDGGLPQAADLVLANVRALGVAPGDVRLVLHSHAHYDHAGALAALVRATGAPLASNAESAALLARGGTHDLHYDDRYPYPPVVATRLVQDGETIESGGARFTAHFTPGHTPGSLSWTWTDARDGRAVRIAYADSLSAPEYRLVGHARRPRVVDDFRRGFAAVRALPCDVLVTPHPEGSGWRPDDATRPHATPTTCAAYADAAEARFDAELARQRAVQDAR